MNFFNTKKSGMSENTKLEYNAITRSQSQLLNNILKISVFLSTVFWVKDDFVQV